MKIGEEKEKEVEEEEIRGYIWFGQLSLLQTVSMFTAQLNNFLQSSWLLQFYNLCIGLSMRRIVMPMLYFEKKKQTIPVNPTAK